MNFLQNKILGEFFCSKYKKIWLIQAATNFNYVADQMPFANFSEISSIFRL